MSFKVSIDGKTEAWSEEKVFVRLNGIGKLIGRKVAWIRSDLRLSHSNWLTRMIWTVAAKYFSWMRKFFFGVDLKQSRSLLKQLGSQIRKSSKVGAIFSQAVSVFNRIAPNHSLIIPECEKLLEISCNLGTPWKLEGFRRIDDVIQYTKQNGSEVGSINLKGMNVVENHHLKTIVRHCPKLKHIAVPFSNITDKGLGCLKTLNNLTSIDLNGCDRITDKGLKKLSELPHLQEIVLWGYSDNISDRGIKYLEALPNLKALCIKGCNQISDNGMRSLIKLPNLKNLKMVNCVEITDHGLKILANSKSLKKLVLIDCEEITNDGLLHLKRLKTLEHLCLSLCYKLTIEGLYHLKGMDHLKELNLQNSSQVTDEWLAFLRNFPKLHKLILFGCQNITDKGLKYISALTRLQKLNLCGCDQITDTGIKHLRALHHLHQLNLFGCHKLSREGHHYFDDIEGLAII